MPRYRTLFSPFAFNRRFTLALVVLGLGCALLVAGCGKGAGSSGLHVKSPATGEKDLARGERIGALLLTHVEEFARTEGCSRLFLSTTPFLDRAIRLYERFGFRRTLEGPHELFGTPLFTMEKPSVAE